MAVLWRKVSHCQVQLHCLLLKLLQKCHTTQFLACWDVCAVSGVHLQPAVCSQMFSGTVKKVTLLLPPL